MSVAPRTLVTGATSAIGSAIARALAADGHDLRLTGRSEARLQALAEELSAEVVPVDLADPTARGLLVDARGFDCFVHVAGHAFAYARHHAYGAAEEEALFAVDYLAASDLARRVLPAMMRRRRGRLVFIGSLAASMGGGGAAPYAAAKAALEGLARGLATDYGRFGITSNVVAPGVIESDRIAQRVDDEGRRKLEAAVCLKRLGRPAEVAGPVRFLCSDEASYVTGTTLVVSGGLHLNQLW